MNLELSLNVLKQRHHSKTVLYKLDSLIRSDEQQRGMPHNQPESSPSSQAVELLSVLWQRKWSQLKAIPNE
jgi:hypothetical protein